MAWDKLKSLFVVKDPPADRAALEVTATDLDAFEVPKDAASAPSPLPADAVPATFGAGAIDFQALYDQAGIPNTDEVEALEKFLGGLDMELPQASKVAAAKAFLNAIGKSPNDVLEDAGRKIQVVRVVGEAKGAEAAKVLADHQAAIDELNKKIEEHRAAMEQTHREMESVKGQCAVEEGRLQGARTFFGHVGELPTSGAQGDRRKK
ncbi:MAG TPA: hypothetical protein VKE22_28270 [Haliangiales bacterium]|nr:hypothetical protein [Haliangiales bacterium]